MKKFWWINFQTRRFVGLYCGSVDPEMALRDSETQQWLGIPATVAKGFGQFRPKDDRDGMFRFAMLECPLMRIEGDGGIHATVECGAEDWAPIWVALGRWAKRFARPTTILHLNNLRTGESKQMTAAEAMGLNHGRSFDATDHN